MQALGMRIEDRVRFVSRKRAALATFILAAIWLMSTVTQSRRTYQDGWILEGVELQFALLLFVFVANVAWETDLSHIAVVSTLMAFFVNAAPALKYDFVYGSTTDVAAHYDMARSLAFTGQVVPDSVYQNTPGLHALMAVASRTSRVPISFWAKVFPPFVGCLMPLALYMFCKRAHLPRALSKNVIVLSIASQPVLYMLNGTSFVAPLLGVLLVILLLRETELGESAYRVSIQLLVLFLTIAVIFWHPATSLLFPLVLIASGIVISLLPQRTLYLVDSGKLASLGILALVAVLSYWMYEADLVWAHFVRNIRFAIRPDLTPDLVPDRLFEVSLQDQIVVFLFYHARDAVLLILSGTGLLYLGMERRTGRLHQLLHTYGLIWLLWIGMLLGVLVWGFGSQGYRRFLVYVVTLSPILSGYGYWRITRTLNSHWGHRTSGVISAIGYILVFGIAAIQLYPFQPLLPSLPELEGQQDSTPALWMHQVNTLSQYRMLDFAVNRIPIEEQLVSDYIGTRQSNLFFGHETGQRVKQAGTQKAEASLVLLHWPGTAGAYSEQAEYRSRNAIEAWRTYKGVSTVYDNGTSFVLHFPENLAELFHLQQRP
jgi:hypothetical protein